MARLPEMSELPSCTSAASDSSIQPPRSEATFPVQLARLRLMNERAAAVCGVSSRFQHESETAKRTEETHRHTVRRPAEPNCLS